MNVDYVRKRLQYNPETGIFIWKEVEKIHA